MHAFSNLEHFISFPITPFSTSIDVACCTQTSSKHYASTMVPLTRCVLTGPTVLHRVMHLVLSCRPSAHTSPTSDIAAAIQTRSRPRQQHRSRQQPPLTPRLIPPHLVSVMARNLMQIPAACTSPTRLCRRALSLLDAARVAWSSPPRTRASATQTATRASMRARQLVRALCALTPCIC